MTASAARRRKHTRTPQSERVENTQQKIITAALQLLAQEGFKGATLQAIARRAEVSLGALQHHFDSREALMERLVQAVMEPLSDQGSVWPEKTLPLNERAHHFMERAWGNIFGADNYQAAWSLFFGCKATPALFARINELRHHVDQVFYSRFLDTFPEIQAHHHDPKGVAAMVFAALRGAGVLELFTVSPAERDGALQVLTSTIIQAGQALQDPTSVQ